MVDNEDTPVNEPESRGVLAKLLLAAGLVAGLFLLLIIGSAVVPRWWAQRIGGLIDGRLLFGSFLGVAFGFAFTFVPLVLLRLGVRFRRGRKRALSLVVAALLLAAPNLLTLGIVTGSSSAAHAAERILDVDGPGFRGGTLGGAIVAALSAVGLSGLMFSRRRNKRKAGEMKAELKRSS